MRLAEFAATRRRELGLSYEQVQQRGGPSDTRMRAIENGTGPALRSSTLAKIDSALRWAEGSSQAVLNGGEPTPLQDATSVADPLALDEGSFAVSNDEIAAMVASLRQLDHEFQTVNNAVVADPGLHGAYLHHTSVVSTIVGHWVTSLLERNVREGQPLPPMLELALGPYLDAEMVHDRSDFEEQQYRRWLAGRTVTISAAQRSTFLKRLDRATRAT